ncbi:hypothetical protein I350_03137 [Cryptococcus amylolentus CBS 6273]|uniref:DSBA-like thioredoxin domain-containing protein n=1 Tax=Cryptococcus amylolentus CBS 6273 TaxID=1296118 RepID=A0A1E3K8L8_9TREE|nr:hypothetical protein I350_03137 [Cryptococcus amylolentus CBS 6273]
MHPFPLPASNISPAFFSRPADRTMTFLTAPPPLADTITLEVYYGVSSPWAFLGAPEIDRIAKQYGLTIYLKPITVIVENGGIRLKARHEARQAYHALDLIRTAQFLQIPLKPSPKYYPQPSGGIELSAQAIIRIQRKFGVGAMEARQFSYQVQRCIWETEEGDHCDLEVLKMLGRKAGLKEGDVQELIVDRRGDARDEAVKEWNRNHVEAVEKGKSTHLFPCIFGTPNYVLNDEIFWGQDRLWMLEARVKELLEHGAKPLKYDS